jgi:hypothetical protein
MLTLHLATEMEVIVISKTRCEEFSRAAFVVFNYRSVVQ